MPDNFVEQGASDQRAASEARQDGEWAGIWIVLARYRQMKSLFHHVLARHHGVRGLIGKTDPDRVGWKGHRNLWRGALIIAISFHRIMQLQHQMIVLAAQ